MDIKEIMESNLSEEVKRDLYLRKLATGELQGPPTGYASVDKPWLKYYSDEAISSYIPEMSIYDYLYECNKMRPTTIALEYFGRKITYDELFKNIDIVAEALQSYGINEGDIVTITGAMIPEVVYLFYALNKIGAISNIVDPRTKVGVMQKYLNEVNSKLFIAIDAIGGNLDAIVKDTNVEKVVIISPNDSLPIVLKTISKAKNVLSRENSMFNNPLFEKWQHFIKGHNGNNLRKNDFLYNKDQTVTIAHTGGTTGIPKGVKLTNYNFNALVHQYAVSGIQLNAEESWLGVIPPFVAYGSGTGMHLPLCRGMKLILVPKFGENSFDEMLVKYKPNHMAIVPSYFKSIVNSKKLENADLSYIIAPTVGGDAMDAIFEEKINDFLKEHGCNYKISKGYGMTEGSSGVCVTVSDECNEIGCVGVPLVKSTVAIFDPDTYEEVQLGDNGEICIDTPNMMTGYFNMDDETNKIIKIHQDGKRWIHTGDIGYLTKDGILYINGRIKRMIIDHDGFKIFPNFIENVIMKNQMIVSCSVVGVPDLINGKGSVPLAYVVLKEGCKEYWGLIREQLLELCRKEMQDYSVPYDFVEVDNLPVTNIGKIDFKKLEEQGKNIIFSDSYEKVKK